MDKLNNDVKSLNVHMEKEVQKLKIYKFKLTDIEAAYLNAAVVDFFHKMRAAVESSAPVIVSDDRYKAAKSLWNKVEKEIPIGEWK